MPVPEQESTAVWVLAAASNRSSFFRACQEEHTNTGNEGWGVPYLHEYTVLTM